MGAWKSTPGRRRSKSIELTAGVPPFGKIHLAVSCDNQPKLQQAVKIECR